MPKAGLREFLEADREPGVTAALQAPLDRFEPPDGPGNDRIAGNRKQGMRADEHERAIE